MKSLHLLILICLLPLMGLAQNGSYSIDGIEYRSFSGSSWDQLPEKAQMFLKAHVGRPEMILICKSDSVTSLCGSRMVTRHRVCYWATGADEALICFDRRGKWVHVLSPHALSERWTVLLPTATRTRMAQEAFLQPQNAEDEAAITRITQGRNGCQAVFYFRGQSQQQSILYDKHWHLKYAFMEECLPVPEASGPQPCTAPQSGR